MQHLTHTTVVDATLAFAHLEGLQDIWIYCCKGRRLPAIFISIVGGRSRKSLARIGIGRVHVSKRS